MSRVILHHVIVMRLFLNGCGDWRIYRIVMNAIGPDEYENLRTSSRILINKSSNNSQHLTHPMPTLITLLSGKLLYLECIVGICNTVSCHFHIWIPPLAPMLTSPIVNNVALHSLTASFCSTSCLISQLPSSGFGSDTWPPDSGARSSTHIAISKRLQLVDEHIISNGVVAVPCSL
jgi:hypothetical protein